MRSDLCRALESLGPQQSVGEVDQQPRGHEAGKRVFDVHGNPSQPIAGDGIADRQPKQANTHCQHDEIEHGCSLKKMSLGAILQIGGEL